MSDIKSVFAGEEFLVFDGAMGTMLQRRGLAAGELPELLCLTDPQSITEIHRAYVDAGSQVVTTNTFGASSRKLAGAVTVDEVFEAAVRCARESGAQYVAADLGPTGELLYPAGDLSFSDAYELYAEQVRAIAKTDADMVIIETMADVVEALSAILAAKDNCDLPVLATMTFTASGRTFLGTSPTNAALVLGAAGVEALGVNCSAGPDGLQPVVAEMLKVAPCPVIVQANAGLPEVVDGETTYSLKPDDYARLVAPMIDGGASIVGGCCGTDPEFIRAIQALLDGRMPSVERVSAERFSELARAVADDDGRDAEVLAMVLDAADSAELKDLLADEFDE